MRLRITLRDRPEIMIAVRSAVLALTVGLIYFTVKWNANGQQERHTKINAQEMRLVQDLKYVRGHVGRIDEDGLVRSITISSISTTDPNYTSSVITRVKEFRRLEMLFIYGECHRIPGTYPIDFVRLQDALPGVLVVLNLE